MIKQIWKKYDKDMSGKLDAQEFEKFAKELNLTNKKIKYKDLFSIIDSDNSKTIELNEFIKYYRKFSDGQELHFIFREFSEYSFSKKDNVFLPISMVNFYEKFQKESLDEKEAKLIFLSLKTDLSENESESIKTKLENSEKLSEEEENILNLNLEEFKNLIDDKN